MSTAKRSPGPTPSSMLSAFANCRCARCAPTPMTCCTSPAGGANRRCHCLCRRITESTLLDYVRHQLNQQPQPTPQTVNHRLTVIRCLYRFHHGQEIPAGHSHFQRTYTTRCPLGYGRPHRAMAFGLRLKQPRRVIQPLSAEQVATVLGELSYLPRSRRGGLDVTRWPAFLRDPGAPTRRSETGRCAVARSGQGQKAAHLAAARRDHGSAAKLPSPGTAADQLPVSVRFAKRPPARSAYDAGRTPLAVPPSSIVQQSPDSQPPPVSTYLRS